MSNLILNDKKIYDDFESINNKQKRNISAKIYLSIIGIWLFLSLIFIFMFANKTLFYVSPTISEKQSVNLFFNFANVELRELNFSILFRISILLFLLLYPIIKSFGDIYLNKEKINNYWPWYCLYLILSVSSFILFFTFHNKEAIKISKVLWVLIPLYFIDLSFALYSYNVKRKSDPLTFGNSSILIVSQISKAIIVALVLTVFFIWTNKSVDPNYPNSYKFMLLGNEFADWFTNLINTKKTSNLFITIGLFVGFTLILFFSAWDKIHLLINRQYSREYFRSRIYFLLISLLAISIWTIRVFFVISTKKSFIDSSKTIQSDWRYLCFISGTIIVLGLYLIFTFIKPFKTKSLIKNTLLTSGFLTLNWTNFLLLVIFNTDNKINLITLFITVLTSLTMLLIFLKRNNSVNKVSLILIYLQFAFMTTLLVIFSLNQIMISVDNQGFNYINSNLSLTQIMSVVQFVITILFVICTFVDLWFVVFKLANYKKQFAKGENNGKQTNQ
ncbi:hypothetical protein KQ874_02445 [Mycoplasma sp. ES3157-GEN-MYC]|uniref:MSC_0624 family F1-like ATPase-associated membrane protein n=1 Tax=Mycoplasma miroungigenitalium TaxID=754515 RepID=UPI001C0F99F4|nr:hypothetical protein [Mycoplasma miroungigenitalium]MBU4690544.1 hypothetical protein [Mycoplasma miroungigenitalium]MBU4691811.1 hypothetical protein [Mycoplasma miroungigenitalium]